MILFLFCPPTDPIFLAVLPVDRKINLVSPSMLHIKQHDTLCCYFVLVIELNIDYEIVGNFAREEEGTENILSALKILKSWNLDWNPLYSMVDCKIEK